MKNIYLDRYGWPGPLLPTNPSIDVELIIVIPSYNEEDTLTAVKSLYACDLPNTAVEIIVVFNYSEVSSQEVKEKTHRHAMQLNSWAEEKVKDGISLNIIKAYNLPKKTAGVGLARKIGMDEAVRRFEAVGNRRGIIACFDADCTCTKNYLQAIHQFYTDTPHATAALVYFEHPLSGALSEETYRGILHYELHLRYLKNALQYANFPFSYYTIGSCITVTSEAYQKQGE